MKDSVFIMIILIHFLADFGLQTHEQATNKSSSDKWLFYHVGVYSLIWILGAFIICSDWKLSFGFALLTGVIHYLTDWITSRISKPFFAKQDFHNGFVVVGFDQVLHMIQLWFCVKYILL